MPAASTRMMLIRASATVTLRSLVGDLKPKMPQMLRRGDLIRVAAGGYKGLWRVVSIMDSQTEIKIKIIAPSAVKMASGVNYAKDNVSLSTLMKSGLKVLKPRYTGIALCHTT